MDTPPVFNQGCTKNHARHHRKQKPQSRCCARPGASSVRHQGIKGPSLDVQKPQADQTTISAASSFLPLPHNLAPMRGASKKQTYIFSWRAPPFWNDVQEQNTRGPYTTCSVLFSPICVERLRPAVCGTKDSRKNDMGVSQAQSRSLGQLSKLSSLPLWSNLKSD